MATPTLHQLKTPRAAALAGVLSALLFAAVLILIRVKMPEGGGDPTQWLNSERGGIRTATKLMPFALCHCAASQAPGASQATTRSQPHQGTTTLSDR